MSILQMSLSIPVTPQSLSSAKALSGGPISAQSLRLTTKLSHLSLTIPTSKPYRTAPIRMGGGPRTYPGGVSKWQWKRMQAKKSKQLLKARLARERQIYEMRKRAELKAAVSELERPWETVEKPPNLFSVGADEQVKVLADRFQKPGGLDLWSDRDGPELFRPDNGLPSARFFPKGVVHSIRPYRKMEELDAGSDDFESSGFGEDLRPTENSGYVGNLGARGKGYDGNLRSNQNGLNNGRNVERSLENATKEGENRNFRESTRIHSSDSEGKNSGDARFHYRDDFQSSGLGEDLKPREIGGYVGKLGPRGKGYDRNSRSNQNGLNNGRNVKERSLEDVAKEGKNLNFKGSTRMQNSGDARLHNRDGRKNRGTGGTYGEVWRSNSHKKDQNMNLEVFDMSLRKDGSYGIELEK